MFLSAREEVRSELEAALARLEYPDSDLSIERPPDDIDAVFASSVAFRIASEVGSDPAAVAAEIADETEVETCEYIDAVGSHGPYVNFFPSERYFADTVRAAQDGDYGTLEPTGDEVLVEHTSANPTGPIHIGRARNPIIGDAIARVLRYAGNDVERQYYVNDAGRQIAVFTWAYETFDEADLPEPERDSPEYEMVRYYRKGNEFLEEADSEEVEAAEAEIREILQGLDANDDEAYERVSEVVDTVLPGMRRTLERLPAEFDSFVKETRFIRNGATDDVVERLKALDCAVYEDDAWQLDLPDFEKNLVFLRSDGTSLYTTRDLAYHEWKLENFDESVTVVGEDHELQARQLGSALELLGHDTAPLSRVHYSWVNLPEGGMSTREGTGIDLDDLLDEAVEQARAEVEERLADRSRDDDLSESDIDRIAEQVGIGAVRYDIVSQQPTKGITFEWDRALDFEAQSAPYVQYIHARCHGILDEAEGQDIALPGADEFDAGELSTDAERELIRVIAAFPSRIEEAADQLRPHVVATYTQDLAEAFNAFYRECQVLSADDDTRRARLALVEATRITVANALDALGVPAPESM
ncbi:arginine--tRNA ligase [Halosimplex marinum]|uniref:arginine--tRNA ligase n=1 Tax=Halosimplex marinum TaxID=3396620 RepID=UPI003F55E48F